MNSSSRISVPLLDVRWGKPWVVAGLHVKQCHTEQCCDAPVCHCLTCDGENLGWWADCTSSSATRAMGKTLGGTRIARQAVPHGDRSHSEGDERWTIPNSAGS